MFELNEKLTQWRRRMREGGLRRAEVLEELEGHLLEEVDRLVAGGKSEEEAFREAEGRMGDPGATAAEFKKIRSERLGLLALIGGDMMDGEEDPRLRAVKEGTLCALFYTALFAALVGVVCTMMTCSRSGVEPYPSPMPTPWHVIFGTASLAFAVAAGVLKRRWQIPSDIPTWLLAAPFVLLIPFYLLIALCWLIVGVPLVQGLILPPKIVQSAASPDGRFEACVIDRPSIDPPDQHAYLRRAGEKRGREVGSFGVSRVERIHWSPDGALAVFQSHPLLIVARTADFKGRTIPLGAQAFWRRGTFSIGGRGIKTVTEIEFPRPGVVTYHTMLKGVAGSETVDMTVDGKSG